MNQLHAVPVHRKVLRCRPDRIHILVNSDQMAAFRQPLRNPERMPSAAQRAIHIDPIRPDIQIVDHFVDQNRFMPEFHGHHPRCRLFCHVLFRVLIVVNLLTDRSHLLRPVKPIPVLRAPDLKLPANPDNHHIVPDSRCIPQIRRN